MARPKIEAPPAGLGRDELTAWETALTAMKRDATWGLHLHPLLVEYVFALKAARVAREGNQATAWDRHMRRAMTLADQLGLTPGARRRLGVADHKKDDVAAQFADLDGAVVDLGVRRARKREQQSR